MQKISQQDSNKIANLGILGAIFVVLIHTWSPIVPKGSFAWWSWQILSIRDIAVPLFVAISGFLLAGHFNSSGWWQSEVVKRMRNLILPCLIWSILWLIYSKGILVIANLVKHRDVFMNVSLNLTSLEQLFGVYPFEHPLLATLWYVRALMIFVIVSPILKYLLTRWKWITLIVAFGFWCANRGWGINHGNIKYFIYDFLGAGWVLFFLLGMAIRSEVLNIEVKRKNWLLLLGIIAIIVTPLLTVTGSCQIKWMSYLLYGIGKVKIPLLMLVFWNWISDKKWPRSLTSLSFPIYLIHWFIAHMFGGLFYSSARSGLQLTIRFCTLLILSWVIAHAIKRFLPKFSEVLFGGR